MASATVDGWWFCREERVLPRGDGRPVVVGETLTVPGPVVLCEHGLHASERAMDALKYAPGPVLCRVRLGGEIVRGDDKLAATERTILWMANATAALYEHQCDCLERMLLRDREMQLEPAQSEWDAIAVNRRWLAGDATIDELITAGESARTSAWASARESAWASARASAWESAWASARASAWESARASAWASAWESAWASARASAYDTEREWQNAHLERLFAALAPAAPSDERNGNGRYAAKS